MEMMRFSSYTGAWHTAGVLLDLHAEPCGNPRHSGTHDRVISSSTRQGGVHRRDGRHDVASMYLVAPMSNVITVKRRSLSLVGVMSPYPTVVNVVSAQYSEYRYCGEKKRGGGGGDGGESECIVSAVLQGRQGDVRTQASCAIKGNEEALGGLEKRCRTVKLRSMSRLILTRRRDSPALRTGPRLLRHRHTR